MLAYICLFLSLIYSLVSPPIPPPSHPSPGASGLPIYMPGAEDIFTGFVNGEERERARKGSYSSSCSCFLSVSMGISRGSRGEEVWEGVGGGER